MQFTVIANPCSQHQVTHQELLRQGLRQHGITSVINYGGAVNTEFVACWGWRRGITLRQAGHQVLVMERGYLGDRFKWTSLAWNGLNNFGDFGLVPTCPSRFNAHFSMKPWKEGNGEYILIMGQVPGDASLRGRNLVPWYESVAVLAADHYQLPVLFRPHPRAVDRGMVQSPRHTMRCEEPDLAKAMANAHVVITFNSNSAVDAVVAGVPAIAMDAGSMAHDVTGHNITQRVTPAREEWAAKLAWKQWREDEISSGSALRGILAAKGIGS